MSDERPICLVHGVPMQMFTHTSDGTQWWAHRISRGEHTRAVWCNGKEAPRALHELEG